MTTSRAEPSRRVPKWRMTPSFLAPSASMARCDTKLNLSVRRPTTLQPTLSNDFRSLIAAFLSLTPVLWIAVIDHVAGWHVLASPAADADPIGQRRLFATCIGTAIYVWLVHLVLSHFGSGEGATALEWLFSRAWGLALGLTTFMTVYLALGLAIVISARTRTPRLW